VCVGRHHCWAAGPLGLGFPVSLYIVTPSIINTTLYNSTVLMKLKLQARGMWIAVNVDTNDYIDDDGRNALEAIALVVPLEM
jgi:hypothetical protein